MDLTLITPATAWPVTLEEQMLAARARGSGSDSGRLAKLIPAATRHIERLLDRGIAVQGWRVTMRGFADVIELPRSPVSEVSSITYYDTEGVQQTLASSVWMVNTDARPARVTLKPDQEWPEVQDRDAAVAVNYTAGEASPPEDLCAAIRALVVHWFDDPAAQGTMPAGVWELVNPFRRVLI